MSVQKAFPPKKDRPVANITKFFDKRRFSRPTIDQPFGVPAHVRILPLTRKAIVKRGLQAQHACNPSSSHMPKRSAQFQQICQKSTVPYRAILLYSSCFTTLLWDCPLLPCNLTLVSCSCPPAACGRETFDIHIDDFFCRDQLQFRLLGHQRLGVISMPPLTEIGLVFQKPRVLWEIKRTVRDFHSLGWLEIPNSQMHSSLSRPIRIPGDSPSPLPDPKLLWNHLPLGQVLVQPFLCENSAYGPSTPVSKLHIKARALVLEVRLRTWQQRNCILFTDIFIFWAAPRN